MARQLWRSALLVGAVVSLTVAACGCESDDEAGSSSSGSGGRNGPSATEYLALVRGKLASPDAATSRATHDGIADRDRSSPKTAGRISHAAFLGTTILDSTEGELLVVERWTDQGAMKAYWSDAAAWTLVGVTSGSLFSSAPTLEYFAHAPSWVSWGAVSDAYAAGRHAHLALGDLADKDPAKAQTAHDQVATGGKDPSIQAGNVAHVVFLGVTDASRFVGIDIWSSGDPIQGFYTNPQFVSAFAPLFESVSQPTYARSDFTQW